jgi:transposase
MLLIDGNGNPLSIDIAGANQAEVNLIEPLIQQRTTQKKPRRLMYDRAADSDPLRERLRLQEIELICHHRKNRKKPPTQDGRKARRLKRRYRVERTISWLFNCRRLVVRYEYYDHLFLGFAQLACLFTMLKRL